MASVNRSAAAMNSMIKEKSEGDDSARPTGDKLLPAPPMSNETPVTSSRSTSGIVTSGLTSTDPSAPLLLAGLSLPLPGLISLLNDFARHLSLTLPPHETQNEEDDQGRLRSRSRTTIFGTFDESFSGSELVDWMLSKVGRGCRGILDALELISYVISVGGLWWTARSCRRSQFRVIAMGTDRKDRHGKRMGSE